MIELVGRKETREKANKTEGNRKRRYGREREERGGRCEQKFACVREGRMESPWVWKNLNGDSHCSFT